MFLESHLEKITRIMVYKGMVYKGKYSISEKIRVYKCPFLGNFKGIFLCEYSDYELVKGGYKGTHQYSFKGSHKGKLPLIWLGGKTLKNIVYFSKCCHTIE